MTPSAKPVPISEALIFLAQQSTDDISLPDVEAIKGLVTGCKSLPELEKVSAYFRDNSHLAGTLYNRYFIYWISVQKAELFIKKFKEDLATSEDLPTLESQFTVALTRYFSADDLLKVKFQLHNCVSDADTEGKFKVLSHLIEFIISTDLDHEFMQMSKESLSSKEIEDPFSPSGKPV